MKQIASFLAVLLLCSKGFAQLSQGPNSPATTANVAIAGSSQSWTNTGNAVSSNNTRATTGNLVNNGNYTDYLQVTNFGFTIPVPATILGIVVEVERNDVTNQRVSDFRVRIVKGGTIGTTDKATTTTWPSTEAYASYGGTTDLWGLTWTEAEINSANFGVAIAAQRKSGGPETTAPSIDHIRITVHYNTTIPVRLVNFGAAPAGQSVKLNWITANEEDKARFTLERSADGQNFTELFTLPGRGNTGVQQQYEATDAQPGNGIRYYRLKMTDGGGFSKWSDVVAVRVGNGAGAPVFPNPVKAGSPLYLLNAGIGNRQLTLYAADGRRLFETNRTTTVIPAAIFKPGIYFYILRSSEQILQQGRLKVE